MVHLAHPSGKPAVGSIAVRQPPAARTFRSTAVFTTATLPTPLSFDLHAITPRQWLSTEGAVKLGHPSNTNFFNGKHLPKDSPSHWPRLSQNSIVVWSFSCPIFFTSAPFTNVRLASLSEDSPCLFLILSPFPIHGCFTKLNSYMSNSSLGVYFSEGLNWHSSLSVLIRNKNHKETYSPLQSISHLNYLWETEM